MRFINKITLTIFLINHVSGDLVKLSDYEEAGRKSANYLEHFARENKIPGLVAGATIRGIPVWNYAFGQIDVENNVQTPVDAVWRIASISKSVTSALVGRLIDEGRLALNASIHSYLPLHIFPRKTWNNKTIDITLGK